MHAQDIGTVIIIVLDDLLVTRGNWPPADTFALKQQYDSFQNLFIINMITVCGWG